ncbi:hypothetical protein LXL04_012837 [Taraxacum kok-saghyz]
MKKCDDACGHQCIIMVTSLHFHPTKTLYPMAITMFPKIALFFAFFISSSVFGSDPDPLQDYCLPSNHTHLCKNSSSLTVDDFVFSGIKHPGEFTNKFSGVPVTSTVFPALNTLGMSLVRADFEVGGINAPHYHPRATEVAYVLEGKLYSGFVDTGNRVFAKVIEKGEVMVFPTGVLHFQMNVGDSPATVIGSFDSQNPGSVKLPVALFGSDIDSELLEKAFGLKGKEVSKLKKRFGIKKEENPRQAPMATISRTMV